MKHDRSAANSGTKSKSIIQITGLILILTLLNLIFINFIFIPGYLRQLDARGNGFQQSVVLTNIRLAGLNNYSREALIESKVFQRLAELSKREKAGSLLMISIPGLSLDKSTKDFVEENKIGGIILMGGNLNNQSQAKEFISQIKQTSSKLIVAVDQEGYPVARVGWEKYAGYGGRKLRHLSNKELEESNSSRAKELRELGFDINFAPVADLIYPGSWIENRAFSSDPTSTAEIVKTIIKAQQPYLFSGVKHFPGLGDSAIDSHEKLPVIKLTKKHIEENELVPFKSAIAAEVELVMVGHALYPELDNNPASVSAVIQTDILRNQLGFDGIIITDDMKMGALNNVENKYQKAVIAGTNIVLIIDSRTEINKAIDEISKVEENILNERLYKILKITLKHS